jgi:hypothetical protein
MARGLDVLELVPTAQLSANEIAAAKLVRMAEFNPQSQPRIVWPAAFPVVRSYLDQLVRGGGLAAARTTAVAGALDAAERQSGAARRSALTALATQVEPTRPAPRRRPRARDGGGGPRPGRGDAMRHRPSGRRARKPLET